MATIPSIEIIPSGYKANKIYSKLPTDGSGDLDFARTTKATRVNQNGLIEEVSIGVPRLDYTDGGCPSLLLEPNSTNLITQSEAFGNIYWTKSGASIEGDASTAGSEKVVNGDFATDSDWTKGSGWTISGGNASKTGTDLSYLTQSSLTSVIGKTYNVKVSVTNVTTGYWRIDNFTQGTSYTTDKEIDITFTATTTGNFKILGWNGFNGSIDNVSVKEVQGFSAPSVDSPLGAFKLVEDTGTGTHQVQRNLGTISGDVTFSIYVKASERDLVFINAYTGSSKVTFFDLSSGTVLTNASGSVSEIELLSNGYYRCSVTRTADALVLFEFGVTTTDGVRSYQGDGTSGVYIFGAQLEQNSYATSYIPTSGTAITRTQDSASKSGISSLINSSEGVLFVEMAALSNDLTNRFIIVNDNTNNNRLTFRYRTTSNQLSMEVHIGGVLKFTILNTITDITATQKVALKFKQNDYALWVNGTEVGLNTLSETWNTNTLSNIVLYGFGQAFYGKVNDLRVYKTALSDAELEKITSYSSFNEMALALNYKIQ